MLSYPWDHYQYPFWNVNDCLNLHANAGGTFALYSLLCRHAKVGLLPNHEVADDELLLYETGKFPETKVESRARRAIEKNKSSHYLMLFLALLGACMVIADGVLTPAISGLVIHLVPSHISFWR